MVCRTALTGVFLALLLKFSTKVIETQFVTMDPALFHIANNTREIKENGECLFDSKMEIGSLQSSSTAWIYSTRYMLPVLGGLLSSALLGSVRVIQIGGAIMLLSSVLISVSVYSGLMCQSSPIILITWLLLPLFFGLTQPGIMHCIFMWPRQRYMITIVSTLYYFAAVSSELIVLCMAPLNAVSSLGKNSTLVYIGVCVLFLQLTFFLPKPSDWESFEMPTPSRMLRYFQIFSGLVMFLLTVADTRPAIYTMEVEYFTNGTLYFNESSFLSPKWLNHISMMTVCFILVTFSLKSKLLLPFEPRIQLALLMESTVALFLAIFTAVGSPGSHFVAAAYSVASIVDAAAEVLIMVAAYDLAQCISPTSSKAFVFGIMFTVWGLANIASRLLIASIGQMLRPHGDEKPKFYIYHLITLVALFVCSVYHRFLAIPLAKQLFSIDIGEKSESEDEHTRLLSSRDT